MKKLLTIALFAAALFGLSVTASYAGSSTECMPGCYCPNAGASPPPNPSYMIGNYNPPPGPNGMMNHGGVLGLLENHSNSMRLRDKGYARQIIPQNDNGLGMTCYDRALALSARMGSIFSDVAPAGAFPGANSVVFKSPIFSPAAGTDKYLIQALNDVVLPQLQNHVNDFTDSLSDNLGATVASAFMAAIMAAFNALLAPIMAAITTLNTAMSTLNTLFGTLKTAIRMLQFVTGVPFFPVVTGFLAAINAAWTAVRNFITATINAIQATIRGLVNALLGWLMGGATSMAAASGSGSGDCDRIQQLWGNGQPASFMTNAGPNWERALTQTGRQGGTPYFSFGDLLSMNPAGAGANMIQELGNASNSTIVNSVLGDIGAGGGLNRPGNILSYPTSPPAFPRGTLPAGIISGM
ncbi:MAG: hypothetical protein EPN97_07020 [Alphaproteobacteria bacterium]|nr:MAG: hypothetical protein EPN97_07020 [Alphaproteobacteria bacterium]